MIKLGVYWTWALALYLLALPLLLLALFKKKYRRAVAARFFLWRNPPFPKDALWFHACSLGETKALWPIIDALGAPDAHISVITKTGYEEAGRRGMHPRRFLPFELFLPFWARPHKALFVMEAELWPMMLATAKAKGAGTIVLNARVSDRSFPRYRRVRWFYRWLFGFVDAVYAQTPLDKERLEFLGAKNVTVSGNIKRYQKVVTTHQFTPSKTPLFTAASTHEGEEALILDAFLRQPEGCLVVAPRHPERFEKVAHMLSQRAEYTGKRFHRLSEGYHLDSDIVLIDTLGDLINIYAVSDVVILGGSFVPVGGHNPLEPAHFGCRIITGPHIFNLRSLFAMVPGVLHTDSEHLPSVMGEALISPRTFIDDPMDIDQLVAHLKPYVV